MPNNDFSKLHKVIDNNFTLKIVDRGMIKTIAFDKKLWMKTPAGKIFFKKNPDAVCGKTVDYEASLVEDLIKIINESKDEKGMIRKFNDKSKLISYLKREDFKSLWEQFVGL